MKSEELFNEKSSWKNETRRSFLTSALAGGAFGLVAGVVFLLTGATDASPLSLLAGMTLLTATISGLTGLGGALLDRVLKSRGLESHALRVATIFLVMATLTFGTAWLVVINFRGGEAVLPLQQYAFLGGFLGLTFGIVFTLITYRIEKMQQKLLLQEAARNMAVAEERNRMARELHDSISQGIHGIVFSLHSLRQQLGNSGNPGEILSHLEETTQATLQELKRLIMELTPSPLEENDLIEALQLHCDLFSRRQNVELHTEIRYDCALAPEQEEAIYRIVQEALANIQKHASAHRVELSLFQESNQVIFRIKDDGIGFDPMTSNKGNGLRNMATRARQNNGEFRLESRPDEGTLIEVAFSQSAL
jgi:signal transduction histidine kinase